VSDPHARTREYTRGVVVHTPVGIACGDAAGSPAGQVALLSAVNAAVRNHPVVYVQCPDASSATKAPGTIHSTLDLLAGATSASRIEVVDRFPAGVPTIGIGGDVPAGLYTHADRFTGGISSQPAEIGPDPATEYGAALAAMLAAAEIFRRSIHLSGHPQRSLSLWTLQPENRTTGPADTEPIDCGTIWLVGAGGVGSSIAWWLHLFGLAGRLVIIDHEPIDPTNLNRTLGAFWATSGLPEGSPANKADLAARLTPGAEAFPGTWTAWTTHNNPSPDVLLPAANDLGVRAELATYSHPMALTGTTSRQWNAELHLYRAGTDGCINCRHPANQAPDFACATAPVPTPGGGHSDAALSFLSGTAGLLTVAALARLQTDHLPTPTNHWQIAFDPAARRPITPNTHQCNQSCRRTLPAPTIQTIHGSGRWHRTPT
jgi:molybdopterin/thiamine biosynthesis adenylyltransferase